MDCFLQCRLKECKSPAIIQLSGLGHGHDRIRQEYDCSCRPIHIAFIVAFSKMWAIPAREWTGIDSRTNVLVRAGILALIGSTMIVDYGNYLANLGARTWQ